MSYNNVNVNVSGPVQPTSTYKTKVLKGNHSFASQVTEPNMKYVIKHNFDLGGESVTIPANCVLEFDGGSLSNGTLIGNTEIRNIPDSFFDDIDCTSLYISNLKHLSISDVINNFDDYEEDSDFKTRSEYHIVGSRYYYSVYNCDTVVYLNTSAVGPYIRFMFYDKDKKFVFATNWNTNRYQKANVPDNVRFVSFTLSYNGRYYQDIIDNIGGIYFDFLAENKIEIESYIIENAQSNDNIQDYSPVKSDLSNVVVNGRDEFIVNNGRYKSYALDYLTFKKYDFIEVEANSEYQTWINFLTKIPLSKETIDICSDYGDDVKVSVNQHYIVPIPKDCRYILILAYYEDQDRRPKTLKLRTKRSVVGLNDYGVRDLSNINTNIVQHKFVHWNIGKFSNGEFGYPTINENNYATKLSSFRTFFNKYNDYNFLFNEYYPVFANVNGEEKKFIDLFLFKRKGYKVWYGGGNLINAGFYKENLFGIERGVYNSLKGAVKSNRVCQYGNTYQIYRYAIFNTSLYVFHCHLSFGIPEDKRIAMFNEIVSLTNTYTNCILVGDFNTSPNSQYIQILTNAGFTKVNGDTPTFYNRDTHAPAIYDYCFYKGNITVDDFHVCEDAVDDPTNPDTETHADMLSDHFPIAFTVSYNNTTLVNDKSSAIKGNYRYNNVDNRPEWFNGTNWDWILSNFKLTEIPNNSNINNYTTDGNYSVKSGAAAETMTNIPVASGGLLLVRHFSSANLFQIYISNDYNQNIYIRRTTTGTFMDTWCKIEAKRINEISGTTRPSYSHVFVGYEFFDTTLGKPIWASAINGNTVTWVDATGATV